MVIYYTRKGTKWYLLKGGFKVNIKTELLKRYITDYINNQIEDFEIDANEITNTIALSILSEIRDVIKNEELSDFDSIEEIVRIFEKHKIDTGFRHDF